MKKNQIYFSSGNITVFLTPARLVVPLGSRVTPFLALNSIMLLFDGWSTYFLVFLGQTTGYKTSITINTLS